jgi:hypothetical protein
MGFTCSKSDTSMFVLHREVDMDIVLQLQAVVFEDGPPVDISYVLELSICVHLKLGHVILRDR